MTSKQKYICMFHIQKLQTGHIKTKAEMQNYFAQHVTYLAWSSSAAFFAASCTWARISSGVASSTMASYLLLRDTMYSVNNSAGRSLLFYLLMFISEKCEQRSIIADHGIKVQTRYTHPTPTPPPPPPKNKKKSNMK